MIEKKLNDFDDFYGIDGFSNENFFLKIISPLNKNVDRVIIAFHNLERMYKFEKAFVERLDYLNHKFSSEDICPPTRGYQRTADEKKLNYTIKRIK